MVSTGVFFLPDVPNLFIKSLAKINNFGLVPLIFFGGNAIGLSFPTRLAAQVMFALFFAFQSSFFIVHYALPFVFCGMLSFEFHNLGAEFVIFRYLLLLFTIYGSRLFGVVSL